jgi:hypothetical protein
VESPGRAAGVRADIEGPELGERLRLHVSAGVIFARPYGMAQDFETLLKEIFGEPLSRLTQFQSDQLGKLTARLQDIAREAVKEELSKLQQDVAELRTRLARLEEERAEDHRDSL